MQLVPEVGDLHSPGVLDLIGPVRIQPKPRSHCVDRTEMAGAIRHSSKVFVFVVVVF